MAWDSYDDEYHLTPSGWILAYGRPFDALESWTLSVRQPYGWARATRSWTQKWVKPGAKPNMRAAIHLRNAHGPARNPTRFLIWRRLVFPRCLSWRSALASIAR